MLTKQISIFVENRKGRAYEITRILADAGIDLYGCTIADTEEFGIMRCLTDKPEKAVELLNGRGVIAKLHETLVVEVPDRPGGLAEVLGVFAKDEINVEYLYSFVHTKHGSGMILFKPTDIEKSVKACEMNGIKIVCGKDVYDAFPEE